jgi:hypothetical protein
MSSRLLAVWRLHSRGSVTAPQIQRLFFGSLPKTRKRLFRLWQHKLLDRRFQPVRQNESAAPILYTLSRQGARYLVAKQSFTGEAPVYTPFMSRGSLLFIEHTLRRNDFRVALTLTCKHGSDHRCHEGLIKVLQARHERKLIHRILKSKRFVALKYGAVYRRPYSSYQKAPGLTTWATKAPGT